MPLRKLKSPRTSDRQNLLSPVEYDADAVSIRSDQDSDSDDDQLQLRARNSSELRAHDRMVFLHEDETDKLVIDARRRRDLERRNSGLAVPNPLKFISRRYSDGSQSRSPNRLDSGSSENLGSEKRRRRRERRKQKKQRLLAEAKDGEGGELMYEMEEGAMKDGSSTGESSDRGDSDEVDRQGLQHLAQSKSKKRRAWCRWLLIHALIALAFAILTLVAWKLSSVKRAEKTQSLMSNGTALFAPTTLLISLDGFRADFLKRGLTPRLNAFIREGVSPRYMLPSFPSVTFPNHYTLVTGLYPESHGVVGNSFWDPELKSAFQNTDPERSLDPKWWGGEPFWVTAEMAGIRTAIHMWPGSEAHILGVEPSFLDKYNGDEKLPAKVRRILDFLDKPGMEDPNADLADTRPQFIAAYVPNVDSDGHKYGPNSTETRSTIKAVDNMLDQIFHGLEQRNLTHIVNVIVVSDHGMATTDVSRLIQIEDLVDLDKIEHTDGWPLVGLRPKKPDELQALYDDLVDKTKSNPNVEVYLRDVNMPERYHFSKNDRIAPLWIVPKTGWGLVKRVEMDVEEAKAENLVYHPRGLHGYDHEHPLMRAIFVARGPAFPHEPSSRVEAFQNIEVYNMLCDSLGLPPKPNNGTLRLPLKTVGLHGPEVAMEEPADPVSSYSLTATASKSVTTAPPRPSVGVDPVQSSSRPSKAVTVDPVDAQPTSKPANEEGDNAGKEEEGASKQAPSSISALWDWVTDKLDKLWGKLSGSEGSE